MRPSTNSFSRLTRAFVGSLFDRFLLLDNLIAGNVSQVSSIYNPDSAKKTSKNLIIFSRYSKVNALSSNELDLVEVLSKRDAELILVSNSPLNENDVKTLSKRFSLKILIRKNIGRDFGAYRDALKHQLELAQYSNLILLNNSIFWDCGKLEVVLDSLEIENKGDIFGLTESLQRTYHLQSYFLYFRGLNWPNFIGSEINYWKNWIFKRSIVEFGERGFSKRAIKSGMILEAVYPYPKLVKQSLDIDYLRDVHRLKLHLNPTQHYWEALARNSFPGVKLSLLDVNPAGLPKVPRDPRKSI